MQLTNVLSALWQQYITDNPEALEIQQLFLGQGERVINDHIAIRTFSDARVNIEQLAKFFVELGYKPAGDYIFPIKKLTARHYEHSDQLQPKIFISQLELSEFSISLQQTAEQCINNIPEKLLTFPDILYSGISWQRLDYDIYHSLLAESEYAAWLYAFGFRANHFTISVNYLEKFNSLVKVNTLIKQHGFKINSSGGEIKGSPTELLEQSSTMAAKTNLQFEQGNYEVANSYYEFAKRYPDKTGKLYQGFIANSADKIFESTNTS